MYPGAHAEKNPEKPAYIQAATGEVVTYKTLDDRSNRFAQLLRDRGLKFGDHIAIFLENHPRYWELCWGAQRSGLYYTATNYHLQAPEVEYIVDDCEAQVFVASPHTRAVAAEMRDRMPRVHTRLMLDDAIDGYELYEDVLSGYPAEPVSDQLEGSDMLYSSGTTGRPKGIKPALTGQPVGAPNALGGLTSGLFGFTEDSIYLSPAPNYHSAPLRFNMAVHRLGATSVIMERFDPLEFLEYIEKYKVTNTQVVPTMFVRLLKLSEEERNRYDLSTLTSVVHAAAPCPVPVKEQMIEWWGPIIHEYYAGTEGNGFVYCNSDDWMNHKGTVGRAILGTIRIVDDDGNELPTGEPGTIYFEGGPQFEYHNDPEKTQSSRNDKGWSTLGDVGYLDDDGFLYLTDRKAYMIISGGVNIYPQEAENVLITHPKVADVAVFGVPNDEFGEEVKAVVQPADLSAAGPDLERELIAFCRQELAHYKCPRTIDFDPELPRLPTGKLYKGVLRDRYWEGRQTRVI